MPIFDQNDREVVRILDNQGREIEAVYDQNGVIVYVKTHEMTGTLPLTFTSRVAGNLTDYRIYGETLQNGIPSPDMPVDVVGCGVRTENLFDKDDYNLIRVNAGTNQNILYGEPNTAPYAVYIPVTGGETYSFYSQSTLRSSCFTIDTPAIGVSIALNGANTFDVTNVRTAPADAKYMVVFLEIAGVTQNIINYDLAVLTIVKSSTPPTSYEPYGYKLPLTCGGTEYPIYLGQVEMTRRIKKLVLTGNENWGNYGGGNHFELTFAQTAEGRNQFIPICSHYKAVQVISWVNLQDGEMSISPSDRNTLRICDSRYNSNTTAFKAFLQQQYAAGTPVTVWYVLATPTTGIVNEPLMRIGEYADTISFAQAGVTIPTVSGANVLDMTSTVKPSQMYIKGKIKPDGYRKLVDTNGVYILDTNGVQLTVHGQTDTPNA